jgi:hypothetical protein
MSGPTQQFSLLTLWYQPGQTVRRLAAAAHGHAGALIVAASFGLVQAGRVAARDPERGWEMLGLGLVAGLAGLYLFAWLMRNFSRWFGGKASLRDVRTALGWGLLPWTLLFLALAAILSGSAVPEGLANYYGLFFAGFVYGYAILLLSLAAGLGLSTLRAFFVFVITALVSLFPLTLLLQMLGALPA